MWTGWSGWSGVDTPQTVMTTRAPAVLINANAHPKLYCEGKVLFSMIEVLKFGDQYSISLSTTNN